MTAPIKTLLILSALWLTACGPRNAATVTGTFSGMGENTVYLDMISINDISMVDSVVLDDKGRFRLKVDLPEKQPTFYNLRCDHYSITLLLSPGEHVTVKSLGNLAQNYIVEGSEGSSQIKALNEILFQSRQSLDSLSDRYVMMDPQDTARQTVLGQYSRIFIQQKRDLIAFLVNNPNSLSSVYALYQRMPNGEAIFSDERDIVYFRMIADSLTSRYPNSPHVRSLQQDLVSFENQMELNNMLSRAEMSNISYPDIDMPDMFGERVKLSSLDGKVILVDFWTATTTESRLMNAELAEVYSEFSDRGFEIYQVSLDNNRSVWVNAVQAQKLPWISVNDLSGANSPTMRMYNITALPANVLIDREGRIVARNVPVERLSEELRKLL